MLIAPTKCAPKIMTRMPAKVLNHDWYCKNTDPMAEAAKPRIKKTVDNPMTKNSAGRSARFLPLFKSDMVVPDIYAR